jgi:hypothetical protein
MPAKAFSHANERLAFPDLRRAIIAFVLPALLLAGCDPERRMIVTGSVMVDGELASEGARVMFSPLGNTRPASGVVGADGTFKLMTMNNPGVMPGDYKVILINSFSSIPKPTSEMKPVNGDPPRDWFAYQAAVEKFLAKPPIGPGWIPKSYANVAETPLRWNVPKDGVKAKFEVKSTPVKAAAAK